MRNKIFLSIVLTLAFCACGRKASLVNKDCHDTFQNLSNFENKPVSVFVIATQSFCSQEPVWIDEPIGYLDAITFQCKCDSSVTIKLRLKRNDSNKKRFSEERVWKLDDFINENVGEVNILK